MGRTKGRHHSAESSVSYKLRDALERYLTRPPTGRHHRSPLLSLAKDLLKAEWPRVYVAIATVKFG